MFLDSGFRSVMFVEDPGDGFLLVPWLSTGRKI